MGHVARLLNEALCPKAESCCWIRQDSRMLLTSLILRLTWRRKSGSWQSFPFPPARSLPMCFLFTRTRNVNVLPMVNKGLALFQSSQDANAATKLCEEALSIDTENEAAVATLAQLNLQQGKIKEAVKMFDKHCHLTRTEPELMNALTYKYVRGLYDAERSESYKSAIGFGSSIRVPRKLSSYGSSDGPTCSEHRAMTQSHHLPMMTRLFYRGHEMISRRFAVNITYLHSHRLFLLPIGKHIHDSH
jgi:hypothetical protein